MVRGFDHPLYFTYRLLYIVGNDFVVRAEFVAVFRVTTHWYNVAIAKPAFVWGSHLATQFHRCVAPACSGMV